MRWIRNSYAILVSKYEGKGATVRIEALVEDSNGPSTASKDEHGNEA
jgi:hypothetical protein